MTELIDRETFAHLVRLAALEMDEDKSEYVRHELNNQLKAIRQLQAIDVDESISPAIHGILFEQQHEQLPREDVSVDFADREALLALFPKTRDGYIVVPDIPHTTLE